MSEQDEERSITRAAALLRVPELDAGLLSRVERTVVVRRRRRRAALASVAAVLIASLVYGSSAREVASVDYVTLADGSRVKELGEAQWRVVEQRDALVRLEVSRGQIEVDVVKRAERAFFVRADRLEVEVVGTVFRVSCGEIVARVEVDRGRVKVFDELGERLVELGAGESLEAPRRFVASSAGELGAAFAAGLSGRAGEVAQEVAVQEREVIEVAQEVEGPRVRRGVEAPRWSQLARRGDHKAAAPLLREAGRPVRVDELLLAADVMRLSGDVRGALPYLEAIERKHPRSSSAPTAMMTRGKLLLERLGEPALAAQVFEELVKRYPGDVLAEHAAARAAQAWSEAGQRERAAEAARRYLERYPDGPRRQAVRRFGGL
jgi:transmembrane sensor